MSNVIACQQGVKLHLIQALWVTNALLRIALLMYMRTSLGGEAR